MIIAQRNMDTNVMSIVTDLPLRPIFRNFKNSQAFRPLPSQPRLMDPKMIGPDNRLLKKTALRESIHLDMPQALPPQPQLPNDNLRDFQTRLPTTTVPEIVTSPSCLFSRPDTKDKRFYYQRTVGLGWIRRRCPQGTGFHNLTCDCSIVIANTDTSCQPEFYFSFEKDAKDNSNNSLPVGDTNVKISAGAGEFTGVSKIIMWRYSGAEFRTGISAQLSYKPIGNTYQKQALLTNCDAAKTKPTIGIVLNKKTAGDELLMFVRLHGRGEQLIAFPSKNNDWNDATFSFDGKRLTGTVNGITKTVPASGSLMKGSSGLVLGRCEYYNWFTGLMDEVYVYPCVPGTMDNQPPKMFLPL